ncbi:MAG: hypothetical protein RBT20_14185 [Syntrophales bacterium]|jgi:hypothetical protein|nr:hypothetical protein [Syntrophales bacterium]
MYTAYKYMKMDRGLLAVFEKGISLGPGLSLDIVRIEKDPYLKIGQDHYLRMNDEMMELLKGCNRLHIAVSGPFENLITLQGTIEIDDISIGKILAYVEMER